MYILVASDGSLSLQQADNMRTFSIIEESKDGAADALQRIAVPAAERHYWIDADAVIALSPRSHDPAWVDAFWEMLKKAEPYGFSDLARKRVKAHVEVADK